VAVWTGSLFVVWGGQSGEGYVGDGARYDPDSGSWSPMMTAGTPTPRAGAIAAWTGREVVVLAGSPSEDPITGGLYHPGTNSWRPTSTCDGMHERGGLGGVWTGDSLILWGGILGGPPDGSIYTPPDVPP
jgi:hypothetical protein